MKNSGDGGICGLYFKRLGAGYGALQYFVFELKRALQYSHLNIPFSKEGSELLFQVLAERHEKGSVMITTNLGFADWTQVFGDPVMTAALLDRLTHKARIINCNWESYRLKQSLREKSKHGERKP